MNDDCKETLLAQIDSAIETVASQKEIAKIKSLSRYDPKRVAQILYLHSQGVSQTQMIRKYDLNRNAILGALSDYADHIGNWRKLGGKLAARSFLGLSSLQEDLIDEIREAMQNGDLEPTFSALREVGFAKEQAWRMSMAARGEAPEAAGTERVVTQEDYEDTLAAAKFRLAELKAKDAEREEALALPPNAHTRPTPSTAESVLTSENAL